MHVGGGRACDPGMKGCVLAGRFNFSTQGKNPPDSIKRRLQARPDATDKPEAEDR